VLLALQTAEKTTLSKETVAASRERALAWLGTAPSKDTVQGLALRLVVAVRFGKAEEIAPLQKKLVEQQHRDGGIRATIKGEPISPDGVERYLESKFDDDLARVRKEMQALAEAYKPRELAVAAYHLYEQFRPEIPSGLKGWGAVGELDLGRIEALTSKGHPSCLKAKHQRGHPCSSILPNSTCSSGYTGR
jgi:hypothetical protein